jgi:hypothetical protein
MTSADVRGAACKDGMKPQPRHDLSMISGQTPLAFVPRENRFPLFRIML